MSHWEFVNRDLEKNPSYLAYLPLIPVRQVGPTCGLACILSIAQFYKTHIPPNISSLLSKAQSLGLTRSGEFFSSSALLEFASLYFQVELGKWDIDRIAGHLEMEGVICVAYDSDGNHAPCLKGGSYAHWCVVHGLAWTMGNGHSHTVDLSKDRPDPLLQTPAKSRRPEKVLISHGKSSYSQLCSLKDLIASNENLKKVKQGLDPESYLIPMEGNLDQLCGSILYVSCQKKVHAGE